MGLPLDSHLLAGGSARSPRSLSEKREGEAVSPRSRAPAWTAPGGLCGLRGGRAEGGPAARCLLHSLEGCFPLLDCFKPLPPLPASGGGSPTPSSPAVSVPGWGQDGAGDRSRPRGTHDLWGRVVWAWSGRSPELPLLSSWGLGSKSPDLPRPRSRMGSQ